MFPACDPFRLQSPRFAGEKHLGRADAFYSRVSYHTSESRVPRGKSHPTMAYDRDLTLLFSGLWYCVGLFSTPRLLQCAVCSVQYCCGVPSCFSIQYVLPQAFARYSLPTSTRARNTILGCASLHLASEFSILQDPKLKGPCSTARGTSQPWRWTGIR